MKSIFRSRRNKSPHNQETSEKEETPFFGKESKTPFFSTGVGAVQAKLTVGQPGDKYEKEADTMADAVVNNTSKPALQNKEISGIQRESLATPLEDEKLGTAEQRMEEDKLVQEKALVQRAEAPKEEEKPEPQKMEAPKEEEKPEVQKMGPPEEEEEIQAKSNGSNSFASSGVAQQIKAKSGMGSRLPKSTRAEMEASFGTDFSDVTVHTDSDSTQMNEELGAQAFTHGSDVYFNSGKYDPHSGHGKHLLAHELTHVVQQNPKMINKNKKTNKPTQTVTNCLNQGEGDLLPGKVGMVEHINREVGLNEIFGKDRESFENDIRKDYDARKFVCEAGVSAMLAIYYNRDYRNRLFVRRARESFLENPDYYSFFGYDKTKQTRGMLEKKYNISIERGDKDWDPQDIVLLSESLGKLTEKEIPLISNYHFARWTSACNQEVAKNPEYECELNDYTKCGLHYPDIVSRQYTITMYDCYKSKSDDESTTKYDIRPGVDTTLHEIGHAMEYGRNRLAIEKAFDAKKEYARLNRIFQNAKTKTEKVELAKKVEAAKTKMEDTEVAMNKTMSKSPLKEFKNLIRGKRPLSDYSKTNDMEAFAEAYMLYKIAPERLKSKNKKLFIWFSQGGYL